MGLEPILQIVHYSDIHIRTDTAIKSLNRLNKLAPRLLRKWRQGLCGADPFALSEFEQFLSGSVRREAAWASVPLWLVDTGDGTTFGDDASVQSWWDWSRRFCYAAGNNTSYFCVYGNHDAWPSTHPLLNRSAMDLHRNDLRSRWFQGTWPTPPLSSHIPGSSGGQVLLFGANSVDHGLVASIRANGWVAPDRHWETPQPMPGPSAADDVARKSQSTTAAPSGTNDLRILAMHCPVADAPLGAGRQVFKVLANRVQFAKDLQSNRHVTAPIAHMLLGGHTHGPFPGLGELPPAQHGITHATLPAGQIQWVTASLSQAILQGTPRPTTTNYSELMLSYYPHQATVIRLLCDPTKPEQIVVERAIAGRTEGLPFEYLAIGPSTAETWQRTVVDL